MPFQALGYNFANLATFFDVLLGTTALVAGLLGAAAPAQIPPAKPPTMALGVDDGQRRSTVRLPHPQPRPTLQSNRRFRVLWRFATLRPPPPRVATGFACADNAKLHPGTMVSPCRSVTHLAPPSSPQSGRKSLHSPWHMFCLCCPTALRPREFDFTLTCTLAVTPGGGGGEF